MRLLIIDDSRLDRKAIKRLLAQTKTETSIAEAADVDDALGMVAVEHFDCILIDYNLPGVDGVALAEQIAANHGGVITPMVMMTGDPSQAVAEQALDAGLTDFVSKRNLSAEHLNQILRNAIIKHQAEKRRGADEEGDQALADRLAEKNQLIAQALALFDGSDALQQAMHDEEDLQIALDLLRKAAAVTKVH